MKILLIIILTVLIFLIFKNINLVHFNYLPEKVKEEIKSKDNIKKYLSDNNVINTKKDISENFENVNIFDADNFIKLIKNNCYHNNFNVTNQIIINTRPNKNLEKIVSIIKNSINDWNKLFINMYNIFDVLNIIDLYVLFFEETLYEFIIKINIKFKYVDNIIYLQLTYIGYYNYELNIDYIKLVDIIRIAQDIYIIQTKIISQIYNIYK